MEVLTIIETIETQPSRSSLFAARIPPGHAETGMFIRIVGQHETDRMFHKKPLLKLGSGETERMRPKD